MMMHHELAAYNGGRGMERHAFELLIPPLQAYMWTTSNVQSRGVTRQETKQCLQIAKLSRL